MSKTIKYDLIYDLNEKELFPEFEKPLKTITTTKIKKMYNSWVKNNYDILKYFYLDKKHKSTVFFVYLVFIFIYIDTKSWEPQIHLKKTFNEREIVDFSHTKIHHDKHRKKNIFNKKHLKQMKKDMIPEAEIKDQEKLKKIIEKLATKNKEYSILRDYDALESLYYAVNIPYIAVVPVHKLVPDMKYYLNYVLKKYKKRDTEQFQKLKYFSKTLTDREYETLPLLYIYGENISQKLKKYHYFYLLLWQLLNLMDKKIEKDITTLNDYMLKNIFKIKDPKKYFKEH